MQCGWPFGRPEKALAGFGKALARLWQGFGKLSGLLNH
jgi:hypothetical protein